MVHSEPSFCRGGERKEVKIFSLETSLAVQGLGLGTSTAGGMGSIPCLGTEIPQAVWAKKKKGLKKRELPGGPVVRILHFHCCGPGSIPGRGTKILQAVPKKDFVSSYT